MIVVCSSSFCLAYCCILSVLFFFARHSFRLSYALSPSYCSMCLILLFLSSVVHFVNFSFLCPLIFYAIISWLLIFYLSFSFFIISMFLLHCVCLFALFWVFYLYSSVLVSLSLFFSTPHFFLSLFSPVLIVTSLRCAFRLSPVCKYASPIDHSVLSVGILWILIRSAGTGRGYKPWDISIFQALTSWLFLKEPKQNI